MWYADSKTKMPGDFSQENLSAFSAWVTSQKMPYIESLNKEFDERAIKVIACTPPGNKWSMAQVVDTYRNSVIWGMYMERMMRKWY